MSAGRSDLVVDLDHLAQYTSGDRALEAELFDLFLSNGKTYVAAMRAAPDLAEWRQAAHTLKGSARGIGAMVVARLSEESEALPADPSAEEKARLTEELAAALAEVEAFARARETAP